MAVTTYLIFLGLVAAAFGGTARITPCSDEPQDTCTIPQVRIHPCDPGHPYCKLVKGTTVSMETDFTPSFSTNKPKLSLSWNSLPFAGLSTDDACAFTPCPVPADQQHTLKYELNIGKKLPKGLFNIKWKMMNEDNTAEVCCFMTKIKIADK